MTLHPEKRAIFARLAHVLEEASTLAWEISVDDREPHALPDDIEKLAETDPALADTFALMVNSEAKAAIDEGVHEAKRGKTRPAREFFHEL